MPNDTSPGPFQPLPVTLRQTDSEIGRVEETAAGVFTFSGFIEFDGAGEIITAIQFPVTFTEKPIFTFGGELQENSPVTNGRLPTISGMVKDWKYTTRKDTGARLYAGASFIIVVTGHPDQQVVYHYRLEAVGLRRDTTPESDGAGAVRLIGDTWPAGV